jgi:S-adenosylmethionine-diacylglycerol 3-amino-3-carboxypropyl transferase
MNSVIDPLSPESIGMSSRHISSVLEDKKPNSKQLLTSKPLRFNKIGHSIFQNVHNNNLIYNTCWEDPRCDRQLLNLNQESKVVMLTSAGCNALDYALDKPAEIHCVDMNYRQNALLELKKATLKSGTHEDLFQMFGSGVHHKVHDFYVNAVRPSLPNFSQAYWDKKINIFIGKGIRKSFYWHSTSGLFAWAFSKYMKFQSKNYILATKLFEAQTLDEQQDLYYQLEDKLLNNSVRWLMQRQIVMSMLGVPQSQKNLIADNFIQNCLRQVFTQLPIQDNYFWQLYFKGHYSKDCCPNYLKPQNFDTLKKQLPTIKTHTSTLSQFLEENPDKYSHFVLLDHQDWLAAHHQQALVEEWQNILNNSHSGTRILMRSAAYDVSFFPHFVLDRVVFEKEKTALVHKQDRVGTYGSVYLGIVK